MRLAVRWRPRRGRRVRREAEQRGAPTIVLVVIGSRGGSVVCQPACEEQKSEVSAFTGADWAFAKPYIDQVSELNTTTYNATEQFATEQNPTRGAVASRDSIQLSPC